MTRLRRRPPLTVLMAGPPTAAVGGMATAAATIAAEMDGRPEYRVKLADSGGGRGPAGYGHFLSAVYQVATGRYDLLHLHVASKGSTLRKAVLALGARLRSNPYVIHLHGGGYVSFLTALHPLARLFVCKFYGAAAGTIVLGESWRDVLVELVGLPSERVTIVHNGVRPLPRVPDAAKAIPRRVVFVGAASYAKGVDVLAAAWSTLVEEGRATGWECVCLGPLLEDESVPATESMPVAARATFHLRGVMLGAARDAVVAGSSVFCLPSRAEGLPMALLEAMSAGVPGVCSDVGTLGEVLNESNGRLVPPGNAAALAAALDELMNDAATRSSLGESAFATWSSRFTAEKMVDDISAVWSATRGS